jgi:2,3,4,5-tetrahydropyridine-2,6-dicarboxylate N-succinyltransferase
MSDKLAKTIDDAWERRSEIGLKTKGPVRKAVQSALDLLDSGKARVAERQGDGTWQVNQWLKKAVLLSFRLNDMAVIKGGPGKAVLVGQGAVEVRRLEGTASRRRASAPCPAASCGAALHRAGVVLMPSFVNIGAYVDERHDGRHLGHGRLLRADRQELPHLRRRRHRRRARAAAGQSR